MVYSLQGRPRALATGTTSGGADGSRSGAAKSGGMSARCALEGWLGDADGRPDCALPVHLNDAIATFLLGDSQTRPGALDQVGGVVARVPRGHAD
jgi:hypothetical protein